MNAKDQENLQELLKKLSAVRVTLSDDEQTLLDWLIQGSRAEFKADEVEAHRFMAPKPAPATGPDEAMHANIFKNQPQPAPTPGPDEAMHANVLQSRAQTTKPASIILIYDPELEAYRYSS
jgi:hypothetical protein